MKTQFTLGNYEYYKENDKYYQDNGTIRTVISLEEYQSKKEAAAFNKAMQERMHKRTASILVNHLFSKN